MENHKFHNLTHRYFRGQLADSEYKQLTDYLQDKINQDYFDQAKRNGKTNLKWMNSDKRT